jgi:hypothetical protein
MSAANGCMFQLMVRLRRFATLLFLPLAFQLALASKAVVCVSQRVSSSATAPSDMDGMNMSGAQMPGDRSGSQHSRQAPCNRPFGPSDCQPLAACASGAVVPTQFAPCVVESFAHRVDALIVLAPASRGTPPELPPPRA